jgi:phytoene synthase
MNREIAASYAHCQRVARRSTSNFYFSFFLLPRHKRAAMCALYAFLRRTDDLGDDPGPVEARRAALASWRASLDAALAGRFGDPLLPALVDTIEQFQLPVEQLHAVLDGVEMDLHKSRYQTFSELELYCHRVAAAVGLCCVHIWGFTDPTAYEPARACGVAFQLTNILRDLKEDASRDRVYLPQEDLSRFGYSVADLREGLRNESFRGLMRFEIERAEQFYHRAAELSQWLMPDGRRIFGGMLTAYRSLLEEIKRRDGDVFTSRVRLSPWRKLKIAAYWMLPALATRAPQPAGARPQ